jgi:hypothetical protein
MKKGVKVNLTEATIIIDLQENNFKTYLRGSAPQQQFQS